MNGKPFMPKVGQTYENRNGATYLCIRVNQIYNAVTDAWEPPTAIMRNTLSSWKLVAHGLVQYQDGTIEWDHSTEGRFETMEEAMARDPNFI